MFEPAEVAEMKTFGEPGLHLMGFKPQERLKRHYNVKNSKFLRPDETVLLPYLFPYLFLRLLLSALLLLLQSIRPDETVLLPYLSRLVGCYGKVITYTLSSVNNPHLFIRLLPPYILYLEKLF